MGATRQHLNKYGKLSEKRTMDKKTIIFITPLSPKLMEVKSICEDSAKKQPINLLKLKNITLAADNIKGIGPALIILSDERKCLNLIQQHNKLFKRNKCKIVLLAKVTPSKKNNHILDKYGNCTVLTEPIQLKPAIFKIQLLLKSLPSVSRWQEEIKEDEQKALNKQVIKSSPRKEDLFSSLVNKGEKNEESALNTFCKINQIDATETENRQIEDVGGKILSYQRHHDDIHINAEELIFMEEGQNASIKTKTSINLNSSESINKDLPQPEQKQKALTLEVIDDIEEEAVKQEAISPIKMFTTKNNTLTKEVDNIANINRDSANSTIDEEDKKNLSIELNEEMDQNITLELEQENTISTNNTKTDLELPIDTNKSTSQKEGKENSQEDPLPSLSQAKNIDYTHFKKKKETGTISYDNNKNISDEENVINYKELKKQYYKKNNMSYKYSNNNQNDKGMPPTDTSREEMASAIHKSNDFPGNTQGIEYTLETLTLLQRQNCNKDDIFNFNAQKILELKGGVVSFFVIQKNGEVVKIFSNHETPADWKEHRKNNYKSWRGRSIATWKDPQFTSKNNQLIYPYYELNFHLGLAVVSFPNQITLHDSQLIEMLLDNTKGTYIHHYYHRQQIKTKKFLWKKEGLISNLWKRLVG